MFKPNRTSTVCKRGTTTTRRKQQQQHRFQRDGEKKGADPLQKGSVRHLLALASRCSSSPSQDDQSRRVCECIPACVCACACVHTLSLNHGWALTRAMLADRTRPPYVAAASRMWSYKATLLAFITCVPALSHKPGSRAHITACTPTTRVFHRW